MLAMDNFKVIVSPTGEEDRLTNSSTTDTVSKEKKLIRCDLCGRTVNSESQAEAHFKGLYHLSRMQARGLPLPPDTDLEKLRQYNAKVMRAMKTAPVRQPAVGPNFYNRRGLAPFDMRMPGIGMSMTPLPPSPAGLVPAGIPQPPPPPPPPAPLQPAVNSYQMNPAFSGAANGRRVLCEICGVTANSPTQAQSHLNGRKHLTRLVELGLPVPQDVAVEFLEAMSTSVRQNRTNFDGAKMLVQERFSHRVPQQQFSTSRFQYSHVGPRMFNVRSANTVMNAPFHSSSSSSNGLAAGPRAPPGTYHQVRTRTLIPCETCQLLFNSEGQAQAHFNGSKHQKKIRMVNYYQRNIERVQNPGSFVKQNPGSAVKQNPGTAVKQIICPVCTTVVNSDKQMDAHVQGKLHKSKLEQKPAPDGSEEETAVKDDGAGKDENEENASDVTNSVYDLSNCVPNNSSVSSGVYHQQHYTSSESEESSTVATAANKQVV